MPASPLIDIPGHPFDARDVHEAATLARDVVWADFFGLKPNTARIWLAMRARCRRDLLFFSMNLLGKTRISEAVHRISADKLMQWMTTLEGFGNLRDARGNGKTTLSTLCGTIWCLIQDPIECIDRNWPIRGRESRLGINSLKIKMTQGFMHAIQSTFERNEPGQDLRTYFPEIFPEKYRRWSLSEIELRRGFGKDFERVSRHPLFLAYPPASDYPDATITARSLEGGEAGPHSNGEFIDDPVNSKTWSSVANITTALHGIHQLYNVTRTEQGFRIVVGNHWCTNDVADQLDQGDSDMDVLLRSAEACDGCRDGFPVDATGRPKRDPDTGYYAHEHTGPTYVHMMANPDGSTPDLDDIRKGCGTYHIYAAQYLNNPFISGSTWWDRKELGEFQIIDAKRPELLRGTDQIEYTLPDGSLEIARIKDLECSLILDPAPGSESANASENALTVTARTGADTVLLLDSWAKAVNDPFAMLEEMILMLTRFGRCIKRIGVESVAYQKVLKHLILRELQAANINWITEDEIILIPRGKRKTDYIRDSLGPLISTAAICVNYAVRGTKETVLQIEGMPVRTPNDRVDCLSMTPFLWERRPRSQREKRRSKYKVMIKRMEQKRKGKGQSYGWETRPRA